MASVPSDQSFNAKWIKLHRQHCLFVENRNTEILITGDWYMAGLSRYSHVWEKYFTPFDGLNIVSKTCNNLMRK